MDARAESPPCNRLVRERSPYLRQHAHNPVDWYPWGDEALERARSEDRPIFLSIGYATCHWCHVMERESFAVEETAALIHRYFVPIKVDREERPDLDRLYMEAVQAMTGGGGWPLTLFLTPERQPFYGGTYFPPHDRRGLPGLGTLLQRIGSDWETNREPLQRAAARMTALLRELGRARMPAELPPAALLDHAVAALRTRFDWTHGGFGAAPKFPAPHQLTFLLRQAERAGSVEAAGMVRGTLDAIASGGIHDQLGGGFHRYATDAAWLIPHFEKTLYDQAGLILAYTEAWRVTGDELYEEIARATIEYLLRDLSHPSGGFYSGEDADSAEPAGGRDGDDGRDRGDRRDGDGASGAEDGHGAGEAKREGRFYIWDAAEIERILGPRRAGEFGRHFGVTPSGNWEGANILTRRAPRPRLPEALEKSRRELLQARSRRPRPARDEKIIAAWNGYAIEALARAGAAFREPRYVAAAERAARFVTRRLEARQRLLRYDLEGAAAVPGFLDDFAFLGRGLLALHKATAGQTVAEPVRASVAALDLALHLAHRMIALFRRPDGRLSYTGADAEPLIAPLLDEQDGALPSGTAAAAMLLLRLGREAGDAELHEAGIAILRGLSEEMAAAPLAHLELLSALAEDLPASGAFAQESRP